MILSNMHDQDLHDKVDKIMINDLPHIHGKLVELDWKMKLVLFTLGAVFLAAVGQYFK